MKREDEVCAFILTNIVKGLDRRYDGKLKYLSFTLHCKKYAHQDISNQITRYYRKVKLLSYIVLQGVLR